MNLSSLLPKIEQLQLSSCLISQQGKLIFKHYRDPHFATSLTKINSCTKSVLASLISIAMDQGLLPASSTRVSDLMPQLAPDHPFRTREITLEHLLTMTSGMAWTEFGGPNTFPRMTRSPHWVNFVLEQPMSDMPGEKMVYNSGGSQLLSALLSEAVGMTTARFAEIHLFDPLGIESYHWDQDPQGIHTGGFGLWLRPSDMLKFGQLYLQQGQWKNKQLISQELMQRSVQPVIHVEAPRRGYYGWHWWADSYAMEAGESSVKGHEMPYFNAYGYGGQAIYIIPSLETVVVLTNDKLKKDKIPLQVFRTHIAPLLAEQWLTENAKKPLHL